jgi:hypothetical protein
MSIATLQAVLSASSMAEGVEIMKQAERDAGRTIYVPLTRPRRQDGETLPWFLGMAWHEDSFMAKAKGEETLRVILLRAKYPNTGDFRALHQDAKKAGYRLEIMEPTREFAAILRRYGYVEMIKHDADFRIIEKSYIMPT